jgi:DNA-binding MarR family transcriptional regulator
MRKEAFRGLVEHIRGSYAVMGALELPSTPLVLYALAGFDGEPTVSALADAAGVSLKTASRTLKLLREQGWVVLREDSKDTRMKRVQLTRAGQTATALISTSFVQIAQRVVAQTTRAPRAPVRGTRQSVPPRRGRVSTRSKVLA